MSAHDIFKRLFLLNFLHSYGPDSISFRVPSFNLAYYEEWFAELGLEIKNVIVRPDPGGNGVYVEIEYREVKE